MAEWLDFEWNATAWNFSGPAVLTNLMSRAIKLSAKTASKQNTKHKH